MTATGDMLRRMDYMKRAKNTLGVKQALKSTQIMECSSFVRAANERHHDVLQNAVRKMEADEKMFKDVHSRQLSSVKRFHNTVHSKSASVSDIATNGMLPLSSSDSRLFALAAEDSQWGQAGPNTPEDSRRSSLPLQAGSSGSQLANQKRRHSVQADSSKYGRSFRKLRDVIAPGSKARICPEPAIPKSASTSILDSARSSERVFMVAEAKR